MQADHRAAARETWLAATLGALDRRSRGAPTPLTAEASTRRFWRVPTDAGPLVLMDAPPASERNAEYLQLGRWLRRHGLHAPESHAADLEQGFLLIEDLGDALLAEALTRADPRERRRLYELAIDTLVRFQRAGHDDPPPAPDYDRARLEREFGLFREWFLGRLLEVEPPAGLLSATEEALTQAALGQPLGCVYLDYHARNLLLLEDGTLGLVDFQDLHRGPVCYDPVSLLRDCYLRWPEAEVCALRDHYLATARAAGIRGLEDGAAFARGFDLCGIQRHMKALGIFARVCLERGQSGYLTDMPRVLAHLDAVTPAHPETRELGRWLVAEVAPRLPAALARHGAAP